MASPREIGDTVYNEALKGGKSIPEAWDAAAEAERNACLVEQLERDVAWRKEQDRVWTEFLNVLCGQEKGEIPVFDDDEAELDHLLTEMAQAAVQPMVDFLMEGLDEPSPADDNECGTMRAGMRGFTGGKPWAG
jgi:hypothetical protein